MHIALATPEFITEDNKGGGLASYLNNIAHIFASHADTVTIITLSNNNNDVLNLEPGITVVRVKKAKAAINCRLSKYYVCILNSIRINLRVQSIHKRHPIDLIQYANWGSLALCNLRNIPSVVRLSSDTVLWRESERPGFSFRKCINKLKMFDILEYASVKNADAAFGPSRYIAGIVGARTHRKIQVIESPFYLPREIFDESVYSHVLNRKKYILTHSALTRLKGTHTIGAVIHNILEKYPDLFWVFAGSDRGIIFDNGQHIHAIDYLKECAGEYADRLIFLGTLDRSCLYPVISHSSFCVLPSIADNLPNACIEAMALKRIVIGTSKSSMEQLIRHQISGILIPKDSPAELEKAVSYCYTLPKQQQEQMEEAAYQRILDLEPDKIYQRLMAMYQSIIEACNR